MCKLTLKGAKKKAWDTVSEWVRRSAADDNGYVSCVTCGVTRQWNDGIDAGHFIPKSRGNVAYWMIENIHPQCKGCNLSEGGKHECYTPYMVEMYGQDGVDQMIIDCKGTKKMKISDYLDIEQEYKELLEEL